MLPNSFYFPAIVLSSPGAIVFNIGQISVRWYGVFIGLGFLISYFIAEKLVKKNNLNIEHFNDLIFLILIFSIVFARLWFVMLNIDYFKEHISEVPKIWHGGQSLHGGILGGVLATFIYTKIKKVSFYAYMDIAGVLMPLAQSIGRWGNFFNNEAFGLPIKNGFIKLFIPSEFRPPVYLEHEYFHPAFLYESFLDFIIFIFLFKKYPLWKDKPGKTFWVYLLCYSTVRFFIEFIRLDSLYLFNLFPSAQIVSIILIIVSIFILRKCK